MQLPLSLFLTKRFLKLILDCVVPGLLLWILMGLYSFFGSNLLSSGVLLFCACSFSTCNTLGFHCVPSHTGHPYNELAISFDTSWTALPQMNVLLPSVQITA